MDDSKAPLYDSLLSLHVVNRQTFAQSRFVWY
jgi:hypothetical protein